MTIDHSHQSPNHSSRDGALIRMIVLHASVGGIVSTLTWLCSPSSDVSSHYVIDRDGTTYQLVALEEEAWHAGKSQWHGLDSADIQRCSVGIELINKNTGIDPYPAPQMAALLELSRHLVATYGITPEMTTRHLDVAIPAGRKTDPAGFPWAAFKASLFAPQPPQPPHYATSAGPFGAIARTDYRAPAPAAAYFAPGTPIALDDVLKNGYRHAASGIGFIAEGDLVFG